MSQVLLGFRNLAFRIAVFVALAAALVWFLGGSLLARPEYLTRSTATAGTQSAGLVEVRLRQVIVPLSTLPSDRTYLQVETRAGGAWEQCPSQDRLRVATDLQTILRADQSPEVWFAGQPLDERSGWRLYRIGAYGTCPELVVELADRFDAERQLARVAAGLPLQEPAAAAAARDAALRAGDEP